MLIKIVYGKKSWSVETVLKIKTVSNLSIKIIFPPEKGKKGGMFVKRGKGKGKGKEIKRERGKVGV